jgi:Zn-dependent M28 family amino/carboxypeptidase
VTTARGAAAALLAAAIAVGVARAEDPAPTAVPSTDGVARLRATVEHLASPELGGRKETADRRAAAEWIAKELTSAGLVPIPGRDSMIVPFAGTEDRPAGQNVAAWFPGGGPEHVIVSAHYDHLGRRGGVLHPGADDNASGVAALLECARRFAKGPKPRRSICFVAFDLEEGESWSKGPAGSTSWVESPPVPLERLAAFVTADMLGRSLGDAFPGTLFVMGSERAFALDRVVRSLDLPEGFTIHRLGMDFNALGWSDYLPFERKRIPCLFFTTGACRDYHLPGDTADKIDYPRLAVHAGLVAEATERLANLPDQGAWDIPGKPAWIDAPHPTLDEVRSVLTIVKTAEAQAASLGATGPQRAMIGIYRSSLEQLLKKGFVTKGERLGVRFGALRLFQEAQRLSAPQGAPPADGAPGGMDSSGR